MSILTHVVCWSGQCICLESVLSLSLNNIVLLLRRIGMGSYSQLLRSEVKSLKAQGQPRSIGNDAAMPLLSTTWATDVASLYPCYLEDVWWCWKKGHYNDMEYYNNNNRNTVISWNWCLWWHLVLAPEVFHPTALKLLWTPLEADPGSECFSLGCSL